VESHKSFGKVESKPFGGITRWYFTVFIVLVILCLKLLFTCRNHLEATVKAYNHYYDVHGGSGGIKSREVNGRMVLEGVLRIYWGIHSVIQLKEDDDQRLPIATSPSKHQRRAVSNGIDFQVLLY